MDIMAGESVDRSLMNRIVVNVCRIPVAVCFIFSGFVKAVDPVGTCIKFQDYLLAFGKYGVIPEDILLIAAGLLAAMEFMLGIYMLFGVYTRGTVIMLLAVMCVFTPLTLYIALNNPVSDCGCFGDALVLTNWQTFWKNVFLLAMIIVLLVGHRYIIPFISEKRAWMVTLVTAVLIFQFIRSNIRDLPIFDFRPYKVGTDLRAAVLEGKDARMADFMLMDDDFDDMTFTVLENPGYTFLVVASHLEDASDENADLIDDLYDYCTENGYAMYGLTASGSDAVAEWVENTGAEYRFLRADEIPLQTMIRSNPGLVLLKDGVIEAKWSHGNIPDDAELSAPMDRLERQNPELSIGWVRGVWVLMMFLLPYVLILLIDIYKLNLQ